MKQEKNRKRYLNYPKTLPLNLIKLPEAYNDIGRIYFEEMWIDSEILSNFETYYSFQSYIDKSVHSLLEKNYSHDDLILMTNHLTEKFNRQMELVKKNEEEQKKRGDKRKRISDKSHWVKKDKGMPFWVGSEKYISEEYGYHAIERLEESINKLSYGQELEYPHVYHILQHKIVQKDIIRILYDGKVNEIPSSAKIMSACGKLTEIPNYKWLSGDIEFSYSHPIVEMVEYNGYVSKVVYKGHLLLEKTAVIEYIKTLTKVKKDSKGGTPKETSDLNPRLSIPAMSSLDNENWRDDVKMSCIDYYNEKKEFPTAAPLRLFITNKKSSDSNYCQHIESFDVHNSKVIMLHNKPKDFKTFSGLVKKYVDEFSKNID